MGYILIVFIVIGLSYRAFTIITNHSERGGLPYIQLLNYSMPVVEKQVYNDKAYVENTLTIKNIIVETLGLNKISTFNIVSNEISFFKNISISNKIKDPQISSKPKPFFSNKFELSEDSIAKITQEELEQLNKVSEAFDPNLKSILENKNLNVLIYHTHTQEGYAECGADSRYRNPDESINVQGVGDILAKELIEGYGVNVIHDKTIHDNDYNICYDKSNETLTSYLNEYGDFDLIIDLHRDSTENRNSMVANINNQDLARMMFVTTINSTNLDANTSLANELCDISDSLFPGLVREKRILHYDIGGINAFNMSYSDNSVVWEVGGVANTSMEAKLTAKYIARIIAEYFNSNN